MIEYFDALFKEYERARKVKNYKTSDGIRELLKGWDVDIVDHSWGSVMHTHKFGERIRQLIYTLDNARDDNEWEEKTK